MKEYKILKSTTQPQSTDVLWYDQNTHTLKHFYPKDGKWETTTENEVTRAKAAEKTLQTNIDTKIDLNSGVTTNRPTDKTAGYQYFDTTLNKPIWYTGSKWVDATGTAV